MMMDGGCYYSLQSPIWHEMKIVWHFGYFAKKKAVSWIGARGIIDPQSRHLS